MLAVSLTDFKSPPVTFTIGVGILVWTVVRMRKRAKMAAQKPKQKQPPPSPTVIRQSERSSVSEVHGLTEELNRLMVEMHDAARQIAAQIDNRYAKLEDLIAEADKRIAALNGDSRAGQPTPATPVSAAKALKEMLRPPQPAPPESEPDTINDSRHAAVYRLADTGKSTAQIAQELDRPIGEIELILNLRKRNSPAQSQRSN